MVRIEDFFISSNAVSNIPEEEYQKINVLIDTCEAVSRITYQSLYIIDYSKKFFLYVSNNPMFLCWHTAGEVKEMDYLFYLNHVPEQKQTMFFEGCKYSGWCEAADCNDALGLCKGKYR